jgi:hypothetical protein
MLAAKEASSTASNTDDDDVPMWDRQKHICKLIRYWI